MLGNIFALLKFLPVFENPDFSPGHWPEPQKGVMPYPCFDEAVIEFEKAAYEAGCVRPDVGWVDWVRTDEARALRDNPDLLAQASHDQLEHLLTAIIRSNRFSIGGGLAAFESKLILNILRRAKVLAESQHSAD